MQLLWEVVLAQTCNTHYSNSWRIFLLKCERFDYKHTLKKHVSAVNEGKKPFKCDNCKATFNYQQNIDRHMTGVHEGKKQLECDYRFAQKLSWKAHII